MGEHELSTEGLVLRRMAMSAGHDDQTLHAAVRAGSLKRVYRGLYVPAGNSDDAMGREERERLYRFRVLGAVDAGTADKAVSHWSAAALLGLPTFGEDLERVHFTVNRAEGGHGGGRACRVHATPWEADEIIRLPGLTVTTIARTAVDISRLGTFEQALCACDGALRMGVSRTELERVLARAGRRKGVGKARRAVALADGAAESVGESLSRARMHAMPDIPVPELQPKIYGPGGELVARSDFRIKDHLLGEFDGRDKYVRYLRPGETPADAVYREKRREERLNELGFVVARWGWADLMHPERLHGILRNGLRRAGLQ